MNIRRWLVIAAASLLLIGAGCAATSPITVPIEQGRKATDKLKAINELQETRNLELESVK